MNTINGILFNFDEVPPSWRFCFCSGCPKHEECLRYQLGLHVPESMTWGSAVFPTAYKNGDCMHFKQIRVIHAAYGFAPLYSEVKQQEPLTTYYRINL